MSFLSVVPLYSLLNQWILSHDVMNFSFASYRIAARLPNEQKFGIKNSRVTESLALTIEFWKKSYLQSRKLYFVRLRVRPCIHAPNLCNFNRYWTVEPWIKLAIFSLFLNYLITQSVAAEKMGLSHWTVSAPNTPLPICYPSPTR